MSGNEFKRMHDGGRVDLLPYLKAVLSGRSDVELMVGCDSHHRAQHTVYSTAVVLRYHRNGAQVIYRREQVPKVADLWTRLWGEVERSLAVARFLRDEGGIAVRRIDLDINSDARHGSHQVHAAAIGYIRAHGYEPSTKPDLLIATWAANLLCNRHARMHEAPIHGAWTGAT